MEKTLVLIKPDGVKRNLIGDVIRRFETKGYSVVDLAMVNATEDLLADHYEEHADKPFYPGLVSYMTSGPIVAMVLEGHRVIEGVRSLCGTTDPTTAAPGTIRGDLGRDWGTGQIENIVHASDSTESATREIGIWFPPVR